MAGIADIYDIVFTASTSRVPDICKLPYTTGWASASVSGGLPGSHAMDTKSLWTVLSGCAIISIHP